MIFQKYLKLNGFDLGGGENLPLQINIFLNL